MLLEQTSWTFNNEYEAIPPHMREAIVRYLNHGQLTGDFLRAVVSNDLFKAVGHADRVNLPLIPLYVQWFFNRAPLACYGSPETVTEWTSNDGLSGQPN